MSEPSDSFALARWTRNLDELDHEIARLALLARVPILDAGVIARVLERDATVCGADNPAAFARLHDLLKVHLAVRERMAGQIGHEPTAAIEARLIARLAKAFPDGLGNWQAR